MTVARGTRLYTPDEYRSMEATAEGRNEFWDGEIVAMSGGTLEDSQISGNLLALLREVCRQTGAQALNGDLRIWIPAYRRGTYPDAMVVAEEVRFTEGRRDEILNPSLIVEVLSKSTEAYDRGDKFRFYRSIPEFREYLLVSQSGPVVEQYIKTESGEWLLRTHEGLAGSVALTTVSAGLAMAGIYEAVEFVADS